MINEKLKDYQKNIYFLWLNLQITMQYIRSDSNYIEYMRKLCKQLLETYKYIF